MGGGKRFFFWILFFVLSSILFSFAIDKTDLFYKDNKFSAYIINNVSYITKEDLSFIIGSPVVWDPKEKVVVVENMRIYSKVAIYKGELLVAIKEVLTALGYQIKWDQVSRTITIIPPSSNNTEYKAKVKMQEVNKQNNNKQENNRIDGNKKEDISDSNNIKKYEIPLDSNVKKDSSFNTVFIPRSAFNEDFKVTVSDMKEGKVYKGMYNAQDGYKFVIVSVSQQNLSNKVQLYTGKFSLYDNRGVKYDYIEGLSSYVLQILMPMGINFGTLVFEIPENSVPTRIVLETYGSTPIVVNLL